MADGHDQKSALIAQLAAQRTQLSRHVECVRESLDVGARLRSSFLENRAAWLIGAIVAGIVLTQFGRRGRSKATGKNVPLKAAAGAGMAWPLAKVAFDITRPLLVSLLTARIADFATRYQRQRPGGAR